MLLKRKILLGAIAASVASAAFFSHSVIAAGYFTETYYYSDATKTMDVGATITTCQGKSYTKGRVTPYKLTFREPC